MPMTDSDIDDLKSQLAAAKKHPFNFGACLAPKPEDSIMVLHRTLQGTALAKQAKASAGAGKLLSGSLTVNGKVVQIKTDNDVAGAVANLEKMLRKNGMAFTVETLPADAVLGSAPDSSAGEMEKDDTADDPVAGPHPRQTEWSKMEAALAPLLDGSLSRLEDASKLRGAWNYALAAAGDGDIPTAIKTGERLIEALKVALKAHGKATLQKAVTLTDKVKAGLSDEQRATLRKQIEGIAAGVGKISAKEMEAKYDNFQDVLRDLVKDARKAGEQSKSTAKGEFASIQRDIDVLTRELETAEKQVKTTSDGLKTALQTLNGPNRPKKSAAEKLQVRIESLKEKLKTSSDELAVKREEVARQIKELREKEGPAAELLAVKLTNIDNRMDALKREAPTNIFAQVHEALKSTIGAMEEATVWREGKKGKGGEVRDGAKEGRHGSTRHGAQTGIDGQARRAATGGFTPDVPGSKEASARAGVPSYSTDWNGAPLEFEEVNGIRKIKYKDALQKKLLEEVANFLAPKNDKVSGGFANPVLEKEAVDAAISIMDGKGWNEIYSNGKDWHDLTEVTLVVGPPKKWKGWGYSVTRKELARMSLNAANAILREFEKGDITEQQMLDRLGVERLVADGVVQMTPYATVVLTRESGSAKWKSKTHYPNNAETGQKMDIATRRVRKKDGNEVIASL